MTKKTQLSRQFRKMPLALAVAASITTPASAFQFYLGDYEASIDTTLSAGASWRLEDPAPNNIGRGNGYYGGLGNPNPVSNYGQGKYGALGGSINSDDGNLNFEKGDTFSETIKGSTDFLIQGESYGAFARVRYWYDKVLSDENFANDGVNPPRKLSPDGADNASGAELMDAYVFADFYVGDSPLSVKLGKQVLSWGESTFIINGINVINPVDVPAFRAPGAEIKDALLPVNMLSASLGLTDNVSVEGFVQLEYEKTRVDDCGTFFSSNDFVGDGCGPVYAQATWSEADNNAGLGGSPLALTRRGDKLPPDNDQYGAAVRWYVPELNDTEFGFYHIRYHSRFPTISGKTAEDANNDGSISTPEAVAPGTGAEYYVEYPEDIKLYGLSFNTTTPNGISVSGEYSFKEDAPVQLNSPDLVGAALGRGPAANPGNIYNPLFQNRVPSSSGGPATISDAQAAGFLGSDQPGYDTYNISQIQFTGISFIDQVFGASRLAVVGEIGGTFVHDLPSVDEVRYGRYDQASFGLTPDYFPSDGVSALEACAELNFTGGCDKEGYTTDFSWGYRVRANLTYNDVFAGVNLTPQVAFSHDVEGYAPGPGANFIEGRQTVGLSLRADYLNQYSATAGFTTFYGNSRFNPLHDRDFMSFSVAYSF